MYQKPRLERFGTFSDLTRTGTRGGGDGCIIVSPVTNTVVDSNPNDGVVFDWLPRCS